MTDAEALNYIIDMAKRFANIIKKDMPESDDVHALTMHCSKHILAMTMGSQITENKILNPTVITGLVLLLYRKDVVDKITLVNATNVKD